MLGTSCHGVKDTRLMKRDEGRKEGNDKRASGAPNT